MPKLTTLIESDALQERILALGREIAEHYGDEPILAIGVLKGSVIFLSDLVRAIDGDVRLGFLGVSSYSGTESTGVVRITHDLRASIEGEHVLIVEDIVDTGLTLDYLTKALRVRNPKTLRVATLLDKPSRRKVDVPVDWVGFEIPDKFVVGYGLDLDEVYRNVPYIAVYHPDAD